MNQYDIVFIGQMGTATIVPFAGSSFVEQSTPVLFSAIAASCLTTRVAVVTKIPDDKENLLEPLKAKGIVVFARPGVLGEIRVKLPSANLDERQAFVLKAADSVGIDDIPPFEPCLIHLCCFGPTSIQLGLMRALKARGFRLSVDMQGFVLQPDVMSGAVYFKDVPEKKEIVSLADFVKLDAIEAQTLTEAEAMQDQVDILEGWGSSETIITSTEGAIVRGNHTTAFARFANSSIPGRMGRGDTFIGSYLARRLDHSVEESLRFAVALTSIKLQHAGPFKGRLEEVLANMKTAV